MRSSPVSRPTLPTGADAALLALRLMDFPLGQSLGRASAADGDMSLFDAPSGEAVRTPDRSVAFATKHDLALTQCSGFALPADSAGLSAPAKRWPRGEAPARWPADASPTPR